MSTYTFNWIDLKDKFLDLAKTRAWSSQDDIANVVLGGGSWSGGTVADTVGWLENGYRAPEFSTQEDVGDYSRRRRRAHWDSEDGDIDVARLVGGADDFYLTRADREGKQGLSIEVEIGFRGGVRASTIARYGAWVTSFVGALESRGYDLEVAIVSSATGVIRGGGSTDLRIVVKRPNEASDFTSWSALFAPTCHRHLIFTARGMAADLAGQEGGCGGSNHYGWTVRYDKDNNTVRIGCASEGNDDPTQQLTAQAKAAGLL